MFLNNCTAYLKNQSADTTSFYLCGLDQDVNNLKSRIEKLEEISQDVNNLKSRIEKLEEIKK